MIQKFIALCALGIGAFASIAFAGSHKVTLCHATGSLTNPYVMITVSENGLHGHGTHEDDFIPAPDASDCSLDDDGGGPPGN